MTATSTTLPARTSKSAPEGGRGRSLLGLIGQVRHLWLAALLVAGWEIACRSIDDSYFPPPSEIVVAMYDLWFSGPADRLFLTDEAIGDFRPSLAHVFGGWLVAAVVGVSLGLLIGRFRALGDFLEPVLEFGRAIPPPTLIPFLIVVLDLGTQMQVTTIVFGVLWPVLLNTVDGVRTVDPLQLQTARVFGITGLTRLRRIILPSAAPKIFAGLRVSLGFALILMVISELIGSTSGIGARLISAQREFEMAQMWAGILLLGVLGCLFNAVFVLVERRFLAWHSGARRLDT